MLWGKYIDAGRESTSSDAVAERLARIEASVDVIALEVERIAEAQRFVARLTAERDTARLRGALHAPDGRAVTPH